MPVPHLLLALAVVGVWGTNFVVIKWGLQELPPFLFATLRFLGSALPWILLVRRPQASWPSLAAFGLLHGTQFGLMFLAMRADITPGLASLVIQAQVFFTIALAATLGAGAAPLRRLQWVALALAFAGMAWIASHAGGGALTATGLLLVLAAALCWAGANLVAQRVGRVDVLGFMVWSSLFAVPPLLGVCLWLEGPSVALDALARAGPGAWAAVAWQALGNSLFGYGAWNWLLARHPAALVAPAALLVPVFGMGASALLLAEALAPWKLGAAALVLAGLALNLLAGRARTIAPLHAAGLPSERPEVAAESSPSGVRP